MVLRPLATSSARSAPKLRDPRCLTKVSVAARCFQPRALARRQPSARARTLRAAGIELDPMRRTVTRDGRPLDLSVKEFGVLEALLVASPAFLRAEDLLEQVWDEQADPFTNTVTVTIGRLRRKLGDPPVIATRPGVGYRIGDQPP